MWCNSKICQEFSVAYKQTFWTNILQLAQKTPHKFCDLPGDFTFISPLSKTIILDWEDVVTEKSNFLENFFFKFILEMKGKIILFICL